MALGEFTKQIAQQAILSATAKDPAPPPAAPPQENPAAVLLGQINAMQKALKEDEELVVTIMDGADRIRILEIFTPSRQMAVLSGLGVRVIAGIEGLQLVCRVTKAAPGAKPLRINLVTPRPQS